MRTEKAWNSVEANLSYDDNDTVMIGTNSWWRYIFAVRGSKIRSWPCLSIDLRSHKADSLPIQIPEVVEQKAESRIFFMNINVSIKGEMMTPSGPVMYLAAVPSIAGTHHRLMNHTLLSMIPARLDRIGMTTCPKHYR